MYYLMFDLWLISLIFFLSVMVSIDLDRIMDFESIDRYISESNSNKKDYPIHISRPKD